MWLDLMLGLTLAFMAAFLVVLLTAAWERQDRRRARWLERQERLRNADPNERLEP